MNDAIVTRSLVKRYGRFHALNGFSLTVPSLSVLGLVGRNGAGKTTWMMTVAGFVRPTSGEISILGRGPFDAAIHSGRLTILPQDSELPLDGRPRDLLCRYGRLQGLSAKGALESAEGLLEAFNLKDKAKSPVKTLSHGMRKRVMVAQAFIGSPEVVMLDEPLSGLDPVEADRMRSFILSRRGKQTIVISSHQLEDIERLCTHVAFVADGRLERIESLAALTTESGRAAYVLKRRPDDLDALARLLDGAGVAWNEARSELVATFPASVPPEEANARLLPALLGCGVVSVTSGRSLEDAYLNRA
jgi:ABC-type multidrug transport system ATPase subunit